MKKNYNFTTIEIDNLDRIDYDLRHEAHYKCENYDFLLKRNPLNKILIIAKPMIISWA